MKKLVLFLLAAPFVLPVPAAGQDHNTSKPNTTKPITISGRVSQDGKSPVAKNGESWSITNPDALAEHLSQLVKVKCQISSATHDIRVLSVRIVAKPTIYHVNPGDAAFRR